MFRYSTLSFFLFLISTQLKAQDHLKTDTTFELKELTVTYQADKTTPITFQNIDSKELKIKSTGQEASYILAETPSITVYSDAGSTQGYSYFRMRGIDQTRINISLDGVPLNEPEDQGAYFSNYPDIINSVSKIQIQRGVGTSKNGVGSYGGSIQLFSPNLSDSNKITFGLGYGSFNSHRVFGEFNSGIKKRKALYIRASQIYSDGYKYHSSNNSVSIFTSGSLFLSKSIWKLNALLGHQQNQLAWLGVTDSLIEIDRKTNANIDERDNFLQGLLQLKNDWQYNNHSSLQTSIYYTGLKGNYDYNPNDIGFPPQPNGIYNYAFKSTLIGIFINHTYSKNHFAWTTGVHGNIYDRQHLGSEKNMGELYKNTGYKNEISFFAKAEYTLNRFTFFGDVQFRYTSFNYKGDVSLNKIDWYFINPKAGISYAASPNSTIYYSIGKTGKEPTRNDMFGGSDNLLADSLGNPIIVTKTAEYTVDQELGFRYISKRASINLNLYYMDFTNEIVLDGQFGPNGLALTNQVDKSYRTGIELTAKYIISKHFSLINNSSFNYSRIKEQKELFTPILTPPFLINQEIIYSNKGFSISLSGRFQDKSFIDFANTSIIRSYFLIDNRIEYDINQFKFSLFLNNITNSKYFNDGYVDTDGSKKYFVQSPTNIYASIKYNF